jgi:hypothetical protein
MTSGIPGQHYASCGHHWWKVQNASVCLRLSAACISIWTLPETKRLISYCHTTCTTCKHVALTRTCDRIWSTVVLPYTPVYGVQTCTLHDWSTASMQLITSGNSACTIAMPWCRLGVTTVSVHWTCTQTSGSMIWITNRIWSTYPTQKIRMQLRVAETETCSGRRSQD